MRWEDASYHEEELVFGGWASRKIDQMVWKSTVLAWRRLALDLSWLIFMHKDTFFKDAHYNYIFAYSQLGKKLWTNHSKDIWWFFMECDSKAIHFNVGSA